MRFVVAGVLALSVMFAGTGALGAQGKSAATLTFTLDRPNLPVPSYTFVLREDGTGSYAGTLPQKATSPYAMEPAATQKADLPLALQPAAAAKLFALARTPGLFRAECNSRQRVANTGAKTLAYVGPEGSVSCSYNYSEMKNVAQLTEDFQSMAMSIELALRMERKHRFDRLGLDQEMNALVDAVKEGRATGLSNIAPTLHSLADDPELLERVRNNANHLLEMAALGR